MAAVRSGLSPTITTLRLPRLRSDQTAIVSHPSKRKCCAMGRRWGKTTLGGSLCCACANQGGKVGWLAPTYKNSHPLWRFVELHCRPLDGLVRLNRSDRIAEFPSGGFLALFTGENADGMRSWDFDLVVVDESALIPDEVIEDVIEPALADRDGVLYRIGTPKGRNGFWRAWMAAAQDGRYASAWTAPTAANPMPTIRRAAELARTRLSERAYRQEWLAEFIEDGGGVFRQARARSVRAPARGPVQGHTYVIGVDWGQVSDFTAFSVIDGTARTEVALDRFNGVSYELAAGRLWALYRHWGNPTVIPELNSIGRPIAERLRREGMRMRPFTTTNASKASAVEALALALEQNELSLIADPIATLELEAYESERLPSGLLRYSAPSGMHDDTVIARMLAWHGASRPRFRPV